MSVGARTSRPHRAVGAQFALRAQGGRDVRAPSTGRPLELVSKAAISVLVLLIIAVPCTRADAPTVRPSLPVDRLFDQYGRIKWEDEQARLDNFAIQLMNEPDLIGYIFVYDGNNICAGGPGTSDASEAICCRTPRRPMESGDMENRWIYRRVHDISAASISFYS